MQFDTASQDKRNNYFARCHVMFDYGMCKQTIIVNGKTFVKGNLCPFSLSQRSNLLSDWHNNICYLLPSDIMIGNADSNLRDAISVSKVGKEKVTIRLYSETTGDTSTRFIVCDETNLVKESEKRKDFFAQEDEKRNR